MLLVRIVDFIASMQLYLGYTAFNMQMSRILTAAISPRLQAGAAAVKVRMGSACTAFHNLASIAGLVFWGQISCNISIMTTITLVMMVGRTIMIVMMVVVIAMMVVCTIMIVMMVVVIVMVVVVVSLVVVVVLLLLITIFLIADAMAMATMAIAFFSFQEKHTIECYKHTSPHVCQHCYPEVHQPHRSECENNSLCDNGDGNVYVYFSQCPSANLHCCCYFPDIIRHEGYI